MAIILLGSVIWHIHYSLSKMIFLNFFDPDVLIRCTLAAFIEVNESFIAVTGSRYWLFISKREMKPTVLCCFLFKLVMNRFPPTLWHLCAIFKTFLIWNEIFLFRHFKVISFLARINLITLACLDNKSFKYPRWFKVFNVAPSLQKNWLTCVMLKTMDRIPVVK